jgi:hypothetical protein
LQNTFFNIFSRFCENEILGLYRAKKPLESIRREIFFMFQVLILLSFPKFYCFFRFISKQIRLFRLFRYGTETPKQTEKIIISFAKQTENEPKQVEFRFVSVRTEKLFCLFRGHPSKYRGHGNKCWPIVTP